jgi:hypothetical protein
MLWTVTAFRVEEFREARICGYFSSARVEDENRLPVGLVRGDYITKPFLHLSLSAGFRRWKRVFIGDTITSSSC